MKILPAARASARDAGRLLGPFPIVLGLLALAWMASCGAGGEKTEGPTQRETGLAPIGGDRGPGGPSGGTFIQEDCMGPTCDITVDNRPPSANCGNGVLTDDEACDDSNNSSGDGCANNCLATESGWSCAQPGQPCRRVARCGDGVRAPTEQCDDFNTASGDGCSNRCRVELGKKCEGEPSVCTDAQCGDGIPEGAEACDDGNTLPFDGCSAICLREPNCTSAGCTSDCGDGLVIDEDCDDGNLIDGDGCSSSCTIEGGFVCPAAADCDPTVTTCVLRVPAIFRDFSDQQPNFGGNNCRLLTQGNVAEQLDANGRPTLAGTDATRLRACLSEGTPQDFLEWYTDVPGLNVTRVGELTLYNNGAGGYVNRYGANGEQWTFLAPGSQRNAGQTAANCAAMCLNEGQNSQGPFQGQPTLRCEDNCRTFNDQAQQRTNDLNNATNQLQQQMNQNPPNAATIATLQTQILNLQTQIATLQADGAACRTTCETNLAARVDPCVAQCQPCAPPNQGYCIGGQTVTRDGTPVFFPVDNVTGPTSSRDRATIPEQYGYPGFPDEDQVIPGAPLHNFYFTTEVEYWFQYTNTTQANLEFVGDDDVWVFLNGRLAVDMGGLHVPSRGSITINGTAGTVRLRARDERTDEPAANLVNQDNTVQSATFGLQNGNVYKISIFHAERQLDGSSFQLTLGGFDAQPSNCIADCGDGVLSFGEECDNGVAANNGNYGECKSDCSLGPFCGDSIRQAEFGEDCDTGPGGDATCRGCRVLVIR